MASAGLLHESSILQRMLSRCFFFPFRVKAGVKSFQYVGNRVNYLCLKPVLIG